MAYDYSKEFLFNRPDDVEMVRTVYRTRQRFFKAFDYAQDCARARLVINNVMRGLALYYPDEFVEVRKKVRTKIDMNGEGKWILTVYAPSPGEKIVGRPPGQNTGSTWIGAGNTPAIEYTFKNPIDEWEAWLEELVELTLNTKVKRAIGRSIGIPPKEWLDDTFAQVLAENGWSGKMTSDTTFTMERP